MDVTILFSGEFARRFVLNLAYPEICPRLGACGIELCTRCKDYDFSSEIHLVKEFADPSSYGAYIDDANSMLPELTDFVIAINLHPDLLLELPLAEPRAILIPVEDPRWCAPGLKNQISRVCREVGIEFAAPKPLCTLKADKLIGKLCKELSLGTPEFKVRVKDSRIVETRVLRDTCGCSHFIARKMRGWVIETREEFWKEIHQHQCAYPCMASMERDLEIGETPFHLAGYVIGCSFAKAAGIDCFDLVPAYLSEYVNLLLEF